MKTFVVGLLSLGLLSSCAKQQGANLDPSLALLIPPDSVTLVSLRLDLLQNTKVYQKSLAKLNIPQVDEFAKTTGVDPRKNLWELLFVSNGKQNAVLGRGKFSDESEPRLDNLTKQGAKRFGYKGLNLVGDEKNAVLLVSPTVLAIGQTPFLKQMVDAKNKSTGPPPALAALLKDIPRDTQSWAVYAGGPVSLPFDLGGNLGNVNKMLGLLHQGSYYLDFREGLHGIAMGISGSDKDSQQLEGALKGLLGLGRLSTPPEQKDLQRIWDGFRVTQQEKQVKLYVDQPEELVEKLLDLVQTFRR